MRLFKKLFKKNTGRQQTQSSAPIVLIVQENYYGLSNRQMVKKACEEFSAISTPFTSKMIYTYLNGLVTAENTYKQIHALFKLGVLRKKTVLCSNPEENKHKHFYEINKTLNNGK